MPVINIPKPLRDKLGYEAVDALVYKGGRP